MNNPKIIRAWTFYDWANSAYSLIITSAIFPLYYTAIVKESVDIFGFHFTRSALASYSIAFSFILIAILSPILSSIADYQGSKKHFMRFFCYLGSLACMGMFFFEKVNGHTNMVWGLLCSIIASIGYCGSIVFYNAFLPEIASKDQQDKVSAKGFAMGYIGSVILMIICFALITLNKSLHWGMEDSLPIRISFLAVGLWWIGFAQITFSNLHEVAKTNTGITKSILLNGYKELQYVWKNLKHSPELKKFLFSFFFYNMGVQTVMYMAVYFASDELKLETNQLLSVVLIIQLVAIMGAWLFARISGSLGNKFALGALVICWIGICFAAYFVKSANEFYLLSFSVGMVMGGIQSLSRSTYSKLLPVTDDHASYFSFYDVCEKFGIVIGTLSFGIISEQLGGMRNSTIALSIYFIIGFLLLLRLKKMNSNAV